MHDFFKQLLQQLLLLLILSFWVNLYACTRIPWLGLASRSFSSWRKASEDVLGRCILQAAEVIFVYQKLIVPLWTFEVNALQVPRLFPDESAQARLSGRGYSTS